MKLRVSCRGISPGNSKIILTYLQQLDFCTSGGLPLRGFVQPNSALVWTPTSTFIFVPTDSTRLTWTAGSPVTPSATLAGSTCVRLLREQSGQPRGSVWIRSKKKKLAHSLERVTNFVRASNYHRFARAAKSYARKTFGGRARTRSQNKSWLCGLPAPPRCCC